MKKSAVVLVFIFVLTGAAVVSADDGPGSQGKNPAGYVIFSYTLHKIPKIASNQTALWIENGKGEYITTLYASRFMADGGYKKRPDVCPEWIDAVLWAGLTNREMDAISSATQGPGRIEVRWDCRGRNGNPVPPGDYIYKLEGNIFWENRVLWRGTITIGKEKYHSEAEAVYIPRKAETMERLIEDVSAQYFPN